MTRLGRMMAESLALREDLPAYLIERYDAFTETAMGYASALDAHEATAAVPDDIGDFRPLAEIIELHGYSRDVSA